MILRIAILCCGISITFAEASAADRYPVGVLQRVFVRESPVWGSRTLAATIWYPAIAGTEGARATVDALPAEGRFPVVVYSHGGCGGAAKAIEPVALPIAGSGFVFVQFPHPGSATNDCVSGGERYTLALLERLDDIVHILNEFERLNDEVSWPLHGRMGLVGIIGHSQGGQTALMMPAKDPRVRAAFSLSPSVSHPDSPPALWDAIRASAVPVLIVHGAQDASWTSEGPLRAYDSLPSSTPKAYFEVGGMGHTPTTSDEVALIVRYATALFQYYLKGDESAAAILAPSAAPPNVSFKGSLLRPAH
jgi:pimeloyl-ACP methyl ester carboxylesterase